MDLRLVSYYPAASPWTGMWTDFSPAVLDADFARIEGLGANAVRLFVFPGTFGYPAPAPEMLGRLRQAVDLANAHGLGVVLSLFDLHRPYDDLVGSRLHAAAVLGEFAGRDRVIAIELKNEIDVADRAALDWARAMLPVVRLLMPGTPVTVSARSGLERFRALRDGLAQSPPDFFSYHLYGAGEPGRVAAELADAKVLAGDVPLVVGETGASSAPAARLVGATPGARARDADQARWYRVVAIAARRLGLGAPGVWTANDFAPGVIPSAAGVGEEPAEYRYGLFRVDGSQKPAAHEVRRSFSGAALPAGFNQGFEHGGTLPHGWRRFAPGTAHIARDSGVARSGRASARLSRTAGSATAVPALMTSPPAYDPARPGPCTASAWVRGRAATGSTRVALAWFDREGVYLGQVESSVLPDGTSDWRRLTARGHPPTGAAAVQVHLKSSHNRGAVWFDDVRFAC